MVRAGDTSDTLPEIAFNVRPDVYGGIGITVALAGRRKLGIRQP